MTTPKTRKTQDTKGKQSAPFWRERRDELQRLADEVRLKIHLGGMDAKDAWKDLEPQLSEFEREAEQVTEEIGKELKQMGTRLKDKLQKLRDQLS